MGERLRKHGSRPDLLLTSPAVRARRTAELVAPALGNPDLEQRIDPALYLASPGEILHLLAGLDEAVREVVVVAHNPGLTDLVNTLLPELRLLNLPTAGAVAIDCDTPSWPTIDAGAFRLAFYDYPKNPSPLPP